jgi:hypothetical protein
MARNLNASADSAGAASSALALDVGNKVDADRIDARAQNGAFRRNPAVAKIRMDMVMIDTRVILSTLAHYTLIC